MTRASSVVAATVFLMAVVGCGNATKDPAAADGGPLPLPPAASSAEETKPLNVGDRVPAAGVTDLEGRTVVLSRLVAAKRTVIIFYRGGWCPYCNTHLGALGTIEPRLVELGYQVLAVSPDRPGKVHETREKFGFRYQLLSDSKMEAARRFGIAFRMDDDTLRKFQGYGILEDASGETHHLLLVPSVFIAGTDGVIRFAYANPDYKVRLEPEKLLAAAERAAK